MRIPASRAAQLGKGLAQPRRRYHELACAEAAGFNLAGGQSSVAEQDQGRPVLHAHLRAVQAAFLREQSLECTPTGFGYPSDVWILAAEIGRASCRERV